MAGVLAATVIYAKNRKPQTRRDTNHTAILRVFRNANGPHTVNIRTMPSQYPCRINPRSYVDPLPSGESSLPKRNARTDPTQPAGNPTPTRKRLVSVFKVPRTCVDRAWRACTCSTRTECITSRMLPTDCQSAHAGSSQSRSSAAFATTFGSRPTTTPPRSL